MHGYRRDTWKRETQFQQIEMFVRNKNIIVTTQTTLADLLKWVLIGLQKRKNYFEKLMRCFDTNYLVPAASV